MKFYIETYGCSLNKSDSGNMQGYLLENGFESVKQNDADLLIVNGCAVKEVTENKMLNRIRKLVKGKQKKQKIIVFGCLSKIIPGKINEISKSVLLVDNLKELGKLLKIKPADFSLKMKETRENRFISIIAICKGCLGECSYCCVRNARGRLKSYSIESINKRFQRAIKETPEVWMTAQDLGAYGKDIGESLPKLIKALLENKGNYKIRLGMMNPHFLSEFYPEFRKVFADERIFKFIHIPVQSGSNTILKKMKRKYTSEQFLDLVKRIRNNFPDVTISTDVIVGFPGEGKKDFRETVKLLEKTRPDVINISRYGIRPRTEAAEMQGQLHGRVKKERSRILTELRRKLSLEGNKRMLGKTTEIFVDEKGKTGSFVGRSENYKAVVIKKNLFGRFAKVKIRDAKETYLVGKIISSSQ